MEASFWHERWNANEIGFHQNKPNALLEKHFEGLRLLQGDRIFLPLCGKTLDIGWLLSKGYRIAGAELSETAIIQLFEELKVTPAISKVGALTRYSARNIDIFVGDIFKLSTKLLGAVDAVYDRAALVALPEKMRKDYAQHVVEITRNASQLLLTFEYDQSQMAGPPFSVVGETVRKLYGDSHRITLLEKSDVAGGLKGRVVAEEAAWYLEKP